MKITIDLNDEKIQSQVEKMLSVKLDELIHGKIEAVMSEIFAKKTERLTPEKVDEILKELCKIEITRMITSQSYDQMSMLNRIMIDETRKLLRETLSK
jgi:hypothetical protein